MPALTLLSLVEEADKFAEELYNTIKEAIKGVGKKSSQRSGLTGAWGTPEYKAAHLKYRNVIAEDERS